jgi:hypothetical protein
MNNPVANRCDSTRDSLRDHGELQVQVGENIILSKRTQEVILYFLFLAAASITAYFFAHLRWTITAQYAKAALMDLLTGTAHRPFQYRALVLWAVDWLQKVGPLQITSFALNPMKSFYLIEVCSAFLMIVAFRSYLKLFIKNNTSSALFAFSLLYVLQFNFLFPLHFNMTFPYILPTYSFYGTYFDKYNLYYPSDIPSIMLFIVGLILLYRRNWLLYYPLFVIATFNRETTCFLTLVYLFTALGKERKSAIALHCMSQFLIWAAIKYTLAQIYAGSPGDLYQNGIFANLEILTSPSNYFKILSTMGYIWLPTLLGFRLIKDRFVRRSFLVVIPFAISIFLIGQFLELRDYGDLIPIFLCSFILIVRELLKKDAAVAAPGRIARPEDKPAFGPNSHVFVTAAFLVIAAFAGYYYAHLRWAMTGMYTWAPLPELVKGTAATPFQYRALIPWLVAWLQNIGLHGRSTGASLESLSQMFYIVEACSFFLLLFAFRSYLSLFIRNDTVSALLAFSIFFVLPYNFLYPKNITIDFHYTLPSIIFFDNAYTPFYPHDTPSLLFFTVGLILLHKRAWGFYYPLFVLASLNSETTLFLIFIHIFTSLGKARPKRTALHGLAQLLIWAAIRYYLASMYANNPGEGMFALKLRSNLGFLSDPSNLIYFLSSMGFILIPTLAFLRHLRDGFARKSLLVLIPFLGWALLFQDMYELRVYGELIPVVLAAFIVILRGIILNEGAPRPFPEPAKASTETP